MAPNLNLTHTQICLTLEFSFVVILSQYHLQRKLRKIQDGVISEQDSLEFEYITDLWANLYKSFLCRSAGADFADHDVITYLIELYGLKQISKELFVQIVLDLCRNNRQSLNLL